MSDSRPLARIHLPSHHPSMMGMKNGGHVILHGTVQDTEDDVPPVAAQEGGARPPKRERPMPLTRGVNISHILPRREKASGNTTDMADAVGYLKKQQGQKMAKSGGREVT